MKIDVILKKDVMQAVIDVYYETVDYSKTKSDYDFAFQKGANAAAETLRIKMIEKLNLYTPIKDMYSEEN